MTSSNLIHLTIGGHHIPFEICPSKGRRVQLRYHAADQRFQVRIPGGKWNDDVEAFIRSQESWVLRSFQAIRSDHQRQAAWWQETLSGKLTLRGREYELRLETARQGSFSLQDQLIVIKGPAEADPRQLVEAALFTYARKVLPLLVSHQAEITGTSVRSVVVKRQLRSKWGSASSLGNINLNWLLILLPEDQIRYLIIHELMHLREMNHSDRFWKWVHHFEPDYERLDASLKNWGWVFGLF